MGKILRVNLSDRTWQLADADASYAGLGGRGLGAAMISREIPPLADPLGADNKLILAPGILAGTSIPCSGRLSVCAKSPLTRTIKESNAGGSAAQKLASLGLMAVVVEGVSDGLAMVKIDKTGVTFLQADDLKGTGNYRLIEVLKDRFGEKCAFVSTGPAGEMKLKAASISVTTPDFHIRMAARGGLGAVMGSKNLKALVIDDTDSDLREKKDQDSIKESVKALAKGITDHPFTGAMKALGTPLLVDPINGLGCLATKNYSLGMFAGAEKISGMRLVELIAKRPNGKTTHRCMNGCIIQCSDVLTDEKGELIVASIEFETLALVGSNCMIDDLETIARINRACNDAGVDTMDVGAAIAVAMESGLLPWGDGRAALNLAEEIGRGTERGIMIGNGCKFTGDRLGSSRIPHVKGQSLAAYDPRGLKGTGVTYATSPMGADHTAGVVVPDPNLPTYNHLSATGQAPMSKGAQIYMAAVDTLGLCTFAFVPMVAPDLQRHLIACVSEVLGKPLGDDYLLQLGMSVLAMERAFNEAAGFDRDDDRLPAFFCEEVLPPLGTVFDVSAQELDSVHERAVPVS
jgi:aldehyde:ferredoxin oxidoreductase